MWRVVLGSIVGACFSLSVFFVAGLPIFEGGAFAVFAYLMTLSSSFVGALAAGRRWWERLVYEETPEKEREVLPVKETEKDNPELFRLREDVEELKVKISHLSVVVGLKPPKRN